MEDITDAYESAYTIMLNLNKTYTVYKVDVPDEAFTGEDEDILNYDDLDDPDAFV